MTDAAALLAALRDGGDEADALLDGAYPDSFRRFRGQHATPAEVCRRAAAWLAERGATRVLDVGSGAGRFCVVGALTTGVDFTGVERRGWLVDAAREAAHALGAGRARFVHGDVRAVDWSRFDGFYLFNPFAENHLPPDERIDDAHEHGRERLDADVAFVERALALAPPGTTVVTWHGFGGVLEGYACERRKHCMHSTLERWRKPP